MKIIFEIEYISKNDYLLARLINLNENFETSENSKLGGFDIKSITQPRALEKNKPRLDLFGFFLRNNADLENLNIGQIVELKNF